MSWIKEADLPELPAIFQAISLDPEALEAVSQLNECLSFGNSALSRVQEEAIATVVAVANCCGYGAATHAGFLRRHSGDRDLVSHLLSDYTRADLAPQDRRMLEFAVRVTLEPASVTRDHLDGLRAVGFGEREILSIVLLTCLFNFMNRLANSLGVEVPRTLRQVAASWSTSPTPVQPRLSGLPLEQVQAAPGSSLKKVAPQGDSGITPVEAAEPAPSASGEDSLTRFVEDRCVVSPGESSAANALYVAYLRWCDELGQPPLLQRNFGLGLTRLGFNRRRRGGGRHWWLGVGLGHPSTGSG
jgi:uncharacterized peroxidase-related enzyme